MSSKQSYNALLSKKLIDEFQKRNFEGYYCATKADALRKILELIPLNALISCGGSATLYEVGIIEALKTNGYDFMDPNDAEGAAEKDKIAHQALAADYFLMSANAITEKGELVNADGYGNRVSPLIFGPKNVIIIAGLNKVEPNLETAILRVKKLAARLILLKFYDYATLDEVDNAAEHAAGQLVITSMSATKGRIKIILVGESLGF